MSTMQATILFQAIVAKPDEQQIPAVLPPPVKGSGQKWLDAQKGVKQEPAQPVDDSATNHDSATEAQKWKNAQEGVKQEPTQPVDQPVDDSATAHDRTNEAQKWKNAQRGVKQEPTKKVK